MDFHNGKMRRRSNSHDDNMPPKRRMTLIKKNTAEFFTRGRPSVSANSRNQSPLVKESTKNIDYISFLNQGSQKEIRKR